MRYLISFALLSLLASVGMVYADSFDDAEFKMNQAFDLQDQLYEAESKSIDDAYQAYEAEINRTWDQYTKEIESAWGKSNSKTPSKKEWVSYSKSREQRSSIDFESGKVVLELQLSASSSSSTAAVKARLKAQLEKLFLEPAQEDKALKVNPPEGFTAFNNSSESPLKGQLSFASGELVTKDNISRFADEVMQAFSKRMIQTPQGNRQVVSVSVGLVSNHIEKRAKPYLNRVRDMARRYQIPVSLIYGIMQTESYFNPMARSHVPAYGLMQLVPRSGGRDAYDFVYRQDKMVSGDYLYDPNNNIELGSAYLKLLQKREMRRIKDPDVRMLCAIAAYNTGGGNVAKAFIPGSRNIRKASALINQMSFNQVYHQLRTQLPYEETQKYVKKVWERMDNYRGWDL